MTLYFPQSNPEELTAEHIAIHTDTLYLLGKASTVQNAKPIQFHG